ncbi:NAD(P)/FAD-dependent oxidoreductase [Nocardioides panzhihuensis]|uniref:NADPH-dependent 2,4-dienoyl-CoA reductase/sulfur reductase-like enzyme n=1 Tax=Nocardioides panzhihuensis TaxID=860243 RepID=A0A7Z0DI79_9ACTN|nr:FAD-dependent oxidoreductase [Nocardioides panzhihuensis]NYI75864.1 NADPH-dependent 2,4-dienoyl-CoA reductase/sulfur reductase-like enzyme [Nocardioides panzhihuensis]
MAIHPERIVIVGGGVTAARTAQAVRDLDANSAIMVLSEERIAPYDRPPLSKEALLTDPAPAPTTLLSVDDAAASDIELRMGHRVVGLDTKARLLDVDGQAEPVPFDKLVVATGTRARSLPVLRGLPRVCHLRTADDAARVRSALKSGEPLVLVGGGFIGLEVAAAARKRGVDVTVVEVTPLPLGGVLGDEMAGSLQQWHRDRGVRFRCGVSIEYAVDRGTYTEMGLSDGTSLNAGCVLVGVGVDRELDWIARAGIKTHVGVVCDHDGRTNVPEVFATGDIACLHDRDGCRPASHWTAAVDSAQRVARRIVGLDQDPESDEEYFWSYQGDLRLMSVGHRSSSAKLHLVSGDLGAGKFAVEWREGDEVIGAVAANSAGDFLRSRMALRRNQEPIPR